MSNQNSGNTNFMLTIEKGKSKRHFQKQWTENFGVIERDDKVLCIFCNDFVVSRFYNIERHFKSIHKNIACKNSEEKNEYISLHLKNI
jgi:hypothetical protein